MGSGGPPELMAFGLAFFPTSLMSATTGFLIYPAPIVRRRTLTTSVAEEHNDNDALRIRLRKVGQTPGPARRCYHLQFSLNSFFTTRYDMEYAILESDGAICDGGVQVGRVRRATQGVNCAGRQEALGRPQKLVAHCTSLAMGWSRYSAKIIMSCNYRTERFLCFIPCFDVSIGYKPSSSRLSPHSLLTTLL
ncbi:hypothetical protein MSAN_01933400 [Mycena sanguinolenta]|uniref:Uncharacterized protein n=1 Tax=Mycena sanguinolenta TaxID=230812 RepID=A0A8H7CNQ0_9AGAR|nr:hypothetical protein MSAN_01933400 [Mycena sanguinolenta]